MITVIEKTEAIKAAFTRAMQVSIGENADIILVNIEDFGGVEANEVKNAQCPVLFYGYFSENNLRRRGSSAVPYFYRKNMAYFTVPFRLEEVAAMYRDILAGRKIENPAMMLLGKREERKNLIPQLLHDIFPGKYGCEKGLETARKEFGISGTIQEVRTALSALREKERNEKSAKVMAGNAIIPGVFCDIEGTLIVKNAVNESLLKKLREYAATKPVTLWTGGELEEAEKILASQKITDFPLVSKYDFEGCRVEIVIDDLNEKKFREQYHIAPKKYIKV